MNDISTLIGIDYVFFQELKQFWFSASLNSSNNFDVWCMTVDNVFYQICVMISVDDFHNVLTSERILSRNF